MLETVGKYWAAEQITGEPVWMGRPRGTHDFELNVEEMHFEFKCAVLFKCAVNLCICPQMDVFTHVSPLHHSPSS